MRKKSVIKTIIVIMLTLAMSVLCEMLVFYSLNSKTAIVLNFSTVFVITLFYLLLRLFEKDKIIYKLLAFTIFCYLIMFILFAIMKKYNLVSIGGSISKLKEIILETGAKGVIIFIIFQTLQVIFSPIPQAAAVAVGAQIYGAFNGFIYSTIGVIVGSVLAFLIGKLFGRRVIAWFVGEETTKKYRQALEKKGTFVLPFLFLFPFLPDDLICIIVGMTTMRLSTFLIIAILTRPIGILVSSYFASGKIIPFTGYYLLIWAGIFVLMAGILIYIFKNQEKIEKWFSNRFKQLKKRKLKKS